MMLVKRIEALERASQDGEQVSYPEMLRRAREAILERRRLGLPDPEPPIVDPQEDPLGARVRWVWEWRRDGHAPYYPGPSPRGVSHTWPRPPLHRWGIASTRLKLP